MFVPASCLSLQSHFGVSRAELEALNDSFERTRQELRVRDGNRPGCWLLHLPTVCFALRRPCR